jgi:hypothetical protein
VLLLVVVLDMMVLWMVSLIVNEEHELYNISFQRNVLPSAMSKMGIQPGAIIFVRCLKIGWTKRVILVRREDVKTRSIAVALWQMTCLFSVPTIIYLVEGPEFLR